MYNDLWAYQAPGDAHQYAGEHRYADEHAHQYGYADEHRYADEHGDTYWHRHADKHCHIDVPPSTTPARHQILPPRR